jgi:hypothetical protein
LVVTHPMALSRLDINQVMLKGMVQVLVPGAPLKPLADSTWPISCRHIYPLVNVYKTIEHLILTWVNQL